MSRASAISVPVLRVRQPVFVEVAAHARPQVLGLADVDDRRRARLCRDTLRAAEAVGRLFRGVPSRGVYFYCLRTAREPCKR